MSSQKVLLLKQHVVAINISDDIIGLRKRNRVATICRKNALFTITNVIVNNVIANNHYCSSDLKVFFGMSNMQKV